MYLRARAVPSSPGSNKHRHPGIFECCVCPDDSRFSTSWKRPLLSSRVMSKPGSGTRSSINWDTWSKAGATSISWQVTWTQRGVWLHGVRLNQKCLWCTRLILRLFGPVFKSMMRLAFDLSSVEVRDKRREMIEQVLDDIDKTLSKQKYLTGASLSHVDITLSALLAPMLAAHLAWAPKSRYANGRFYIISRCLWSDARQVAQGSQWVWAGAC